MDQMDGPSNHQPWGSHKPSDRAQSGLDFGQLAAGKKLGRHAEVILAPTEASPHGS